MPECDQLLPNAMRNQRGAWFSLVSPPKRGDDTAKKEQRPVANLNIHDEKGRIMPLQVGLITVQV
ncbi:hypothetical protein [uncultured Corynebacterium sp.]|uniref:hypothetical protein n=1 Tax=uncultured Corynebacterium sp. TaxID=159447 RepID=UPI0025D31D95|nr:hypothetical protein [uncultured Corynebacterium sp.]